MTNLRDIYQEIGARIRVSDSVYLTIKKAVITGVLLPQEKIDEKSITEELDISQTSLREAIKLLEADHYISFTKGKGYTVDNVTLEDLMKINELLSILTVASIEIICPIDSTTAIIISESLNKEIETTNFALDEKFHMTLAFCTKNSEILKAMRDSYDRLLWGMNVLSIKDLNSDIIEDHRKMADYLIYKELDREKMSVMITDHFSRHLEDIQIKP